MSDKKRLDKRIAAREMAMQILFQLDQQGLSSMGEEKKLGDQNNNWTAEDIIRTFTQENSPDEMTTRVTRDWVSGTVEKVSECDELIKTVLVRWAAERVMPLERAILRLCVYQIAFCENVPAKVAIKEGVELAKKYGAANSSRFVNGVLDAVYKKINEPAEAIQPVEKAEVAKPAEIEEV